MERGLVERQTTAGVEKRRSQHEEDHPERAGSVQTQRHGGHLGVALPSSQPHGHDEIQQVPNQHSQSRPGNHVTQCKFRRESVNSGHQANQQQQVGDVVQHQAEKGVDVARSRPGIARLGHGYGNGMDVAFEGAVSVSTPSNAVNSRPTWQVPRAEHDRRTVIPSRSQSGEIPQSGLRTGRGPEIFSSPLGRVFANSGKACYDNVREPAPRFVPYIYLP